MEAMGMKLTEFEEKLTTVSDQKLRLMLGDCRKKGPEVAVNLILAEGRRRGMDLDAETAEAVGAAVGAGGMPAAESMGSQHAVEDAPAFAEESLGTGAAPKGAWLAEEANQGLPTIIKILIAAVLLGGVIAFLFVFLN